MRPRVSAAMLVLGLCALVVPTGALVAQHLAAWLQCRPLLRADAACWSELYLLGAAGSLALLWPQAREGSGLGLAAAIAVAGGGIALASGSAALVTAPAGLIVLALWQHVAFWQTQANRRWSYAALVAALALPAAVLAARMALCGRL